MIQMIQMIQKSQTIKMIKIDEYKWIDISPPPYFWDVFLDKICSMEAIPDINWLNNEQITAHWARWKTGFLGAEFARSSWC